MAKAGPAPFFGEDGLPLHVPGNAPIVGQPEQPAVVITTPEGKKLLLPQVAVALMSTDTMKMIAEMVYAKFLAAAEDPIPGGEAQDVDFSEIPEDQKVKVEVANDSSAG